MKVFNQALSALLASSSVLIASSSDVVNTCTLVDKPEPTGPYQAYSGDTKVAHAHIIFGDISPDETGLILDTLAKRNTKATFFTHSDRINDETKPLLQRMIDEGHTIGSMGQSSNPQIDFLYANNTFIEQQITGADADFEKAIGFAPTLYMPSMGALDSRGQKILNDNGKTTVKWSAGANGWWFVDNKEPTETAVAGIRYTLAEAGGIILMPTNAEILDEYLNQVWPYW
jgi:peptidoglycan/xylan/chitin deacetylase (PgdA/CDA1 family)